jgi:hypothetical protein
MMNRFQVLRFNLSLRRYITEHELGVLRELLAGMGSEDGAGAGTGAGLYTRPLFSST